MQVGVRSGFFKASFYCMALLLCCLCSAQVMAQAGGNGKLSGTVKDAVTKQAVEYATVVVTDAQSGKLLTGATSDEKGAFSVTGIPYGDYMVTVEFIGYRKDTLKHVAISESNAHIHLGTLMLQPLQNRLKDVVVTASAPIIENKIDRIVYNAANDLTSQGGVALDVLKKVPMVNVDVDGNVDVQGNDNIRFLINGKPSSMFNSPADALASIPASQIKSIEVITSPGAKYDAEGTGGIINIILKDNKMQGINGSVSLSAGTRLENGSVNLNIKRNKVNVNIFFSGNMQLSSRTPAAQNRTSTTSDTLTKLLQDGYSDFERSGFQSGVGLDWAISKKDDLTASVGYNVVDNSSVGVTNQEQQVISPANVMLSGVFSIRDYNTAYHSDALELSLGYKKTFNKKGQELSFLYSSSFGTPDNSYWQTQTYQSAPTPYMGNSSSNPGKDRETDISLDYTQPLGEKNTLDAGVKTILQNINSITDVNVLNATTGDYNMDPGQSYSLNYDRQVYAGYVAGSFVLGSFLNVNAGMRFEHTDTKIDFPGTNIPQYNSYVPSLTLLHNIDKQQSIKLAYSYRIERPDYRELNPFVNQSDPYNLTTGNPTLQPEVAHNIELWYNHYYDKKGSFAVGLLERLDKNDIKPVTLLYPEYQVGDSMYKDVSVTSRANIGEEYVTGLSAFGSLNIQDKLNLRCSVYAMGLYIVSSLVPGGSMTSLRARANLNASYNLPQNYLVEAFGNYTSPWKNIQGQAPQSLTYTIAFRKQFWNKNASVGITATNIFSKYIKQVTTINSSDYSSYYVRELPYRSVGVSFSYKFGKMEFKKSKDADSYLNNLPDN
jgi:outer membrane receptor protein involved in Fe transport